MTHEARELLERALKLPPDARADLATRLFESLEDDGGDDPVVVEKACVVLVGERGGELLPRLPDAESETGIASENSEASNGIHVSYDLSEWMQYVHDCST